jgi:hypothetical protein
MPQQPPQAHPQAARVAVRITGIVIVWVTQRVPGRLVGDCTSPRFDRPRVIRAGI